MARKQILFVDDDSMVLQGLQRSLRSMRADWDMVFLDNATSALEMLATHPFELIVSDMRMPGMNGIELLSRTREQFPDTVRIMLTGNADLQTAVDAVNQGNVYRFLTKPCDTDDLIRVLNQGLRQQELITAEKALLQQTLKGTVKMLVDLLAFLAPASFGRAQATGELAEGVARELGMENPWVLGIASTLSQIGILTLPPELGAKLQAGAELTPEEQDLANRVPQMGAELIANIPRMEEVADSVHYMHKNYNGTGFPMDPLKEDRIPMGGRILRAVRGFEALKSQGESESDALEAMGGDRACYDMAVLRALVSFLRRKTEGAVTPVPRPVSLAGLKEGQTLVHGIETVEGLLIIPEGTLLAPVHLQKLHNFGRISKIREPIIVLGHAGE
ncbi:HD domain-containing phosphohydrolase [Holophaga foetida]|uniref:HD domain-containing phosphohydrolase n=1 Tax=Holophaga foetida TaxID=35839 RepID=UPI000247379D|nr:HD domain-containing phosphohydrolase [Holophaga foetida]